MKDIFSYGIIFSNDSLFGYIDVRQFRGHKLLLLAVRTKKTHKNPGLRTTMIFSKKYDENPTWIYSIIFGEDSQDYFALTIPPPRVQRRYIVPGFPEAFTVALLPDIVAISVLTPPLNSILTKELEKG